MSYLTVSQLAKMFSDIAKKHPDMVVLIPESNNYEAPMQGICDTDIQLDHVEIVIEENEFENPVYAREDGTANAIVLNPFGIVKD